MAKYRDYWTIRFGEIDGKPSDYRPEKVKGLPIRFTQPNWVMQHAFFAYKDKHGWHVVEVTSGGAITKNECTLVEARRGANLRLAEVGEKRFLHGRQSLIDTNPLNANEVRSE